MTTILWFIITAITSALGAWLALILVTLVVLRVSGAVASKVLVGGRIGGVVMLLPSFWFAIFIGSPLGGGLFIGLLGESVVKVGFVFGFLASFFIRVLLGAAVGALFSAFIIRVWCAHNAA